MNKYQTIYTEDFFKTLPKEVKADFYDFIENVPFINWLIQPEEVRGFAKDRPKHKDLDSKDERKQYNDSRIVVDLVRPHILENMDYFRERALFFSKHKKYTNIPPNPNPKSEYAKFWKNEVKKWKYGVIRPSDGEWIPGGLYFYWNYSPIWQTLETGIDKGGKTRGERIYDFPKPMLGDYLFYHYMEQGREAGKHGKLLKTRGCGFSFKLGSLSPRNMYVFPGSGNPNFHLASDKTFLSGDKGVFGKVIDTLDWIATNTPLPKLRISDSKQKMEIQLGFLDNYGVRKGLLSSVYGISMKDNPDKARGIRGALIHYEEDGVFPNLESTWNINRKATEDGNVAFSYQLAGGTGGSEGADFTGSEKLFYNPDTYNIYGVPNVYDRGSAETSKCGFFWGAYLNRNKCYDLHVGEPNVTKALMEIIINRVKTRSTASDSKTITQNAAEEPLVPQEAVMRVDGTVFPVADLKEYLANISTNLSAFVSSHYCGELIISSKGEIEFRNSNTLFPIREFPALSDKRGAVEIFEMPRKVKSIFRYCIGVDTYDDDLVEYSSSLGSCIVFDRWTRRIVAEYTGRTESANEFYEICYRLARFYNCRIMYENNKKGLYTYFNNVKNAITMLADTPDILVDKQLTKPRGLGSNVSKGINATAAINSYGLRLQADWMMEKAYNEEITEGEEKDEFIPNFRKIRSVGYLKECIGWHSKLNADRVSAMNMVMIYDAELSQYESGGERKESVKIIDPFFDRVYRGGKGELTEFGYNQANYIFGNK
jgi:hypothetical protein